MQAPAMRWKIFALTISVALRVVTATDVWAAGSTSTVNQVSQAHLATEAEQLAAQGRFNEAAARFESLAAQASSADRDHFILKAARNAQLSGNAAKAQGLLDLTSKTLKPPDHALRAVISAVLALDMSQPERSIDLLDQIPLPLPEELAAETLSVRIDALFAAGRTVVAVNTAIEREQALKSNNDLAQNRQMLWNKLKQAASSGRDLSPPTGANRLTAGWMELAKLYNAAQRDPFTFNRGLIEWRNRYPGHPGNSMLTTGNAVVVSRSGEERLALLLPLSGKQQAAGIAIRDGFLAALLQASATARPGVQVFDTNEAGVLDAYQRATQAGATLIVGPLLKEDVDALANSQQVGTMTLSLNALSNNLQPPALMFQFALDPEEEARQVAQRAHDEGHSRAIAITPNNEWGLRLQRAFAAELLALGGTLVDQRSYDPGARDYVSMAKQLLLSKKPPQARALDEALGNKKPLAEARDDVDFIFLAAQTTQAKQLRPALRFVLPDTSIPIYATSDSYEPESINTDLDGLRFDDMPWVINRDSEAEALHDAMSRLWSNGLRNRSRLYAFGIDAFKLINWLKTPQPQLASPLRGMTGWLALDQFGRVRRQADWAQIVNGKPLPLAETAPPNSSIAR
jgi:uncharacterized protein